MLWTSRLGFQGQSVDWSHSGFPICEDYIWSCTVWLLDAWSQPASGLFLLGYPVWLCGPALGRVLKSFQNSSISQATAWETLQRVCHRLSLTTILSHNSAAFFAFAGSVLIPTCSELRDLILCKSYWAKTDGEKYSKWRALKTLNHSEHWNVSSLFFKWSFLKHKRQICNLHSSCVFAWKMWLLVSN